VEALRHPVARIRANPWLAVGIAAAALLTVAWLGWAIYVASDRGMNEGLGVLIAVPALLIALTIVSLPFIGGYLLLKRLASGSDGGSAPTAEQAPDDEESKDDTGETKDEEKPEDKSSDEEEESEGEDSDSEEEGSEGDGDDGATADRSDEESEPEPEAAAS
jgi:hypothetical protein